MWIGEARGTLTAGQLVVVSAGRKHGPANSGQSVLRIQSTLAEPVFEAAGNSAGGLRTSDAYLPYAPPYFEPIRIA